MQLAMKLRTLGVVMVTALALSACGGGGSSSGSPATTSAPAGSGVRSGTGGYIGGPVNTARDTVNQLNQQQQQQVQQTGG
jgi:hypothetical protein